MSSEATSWAPALVSLLAGVVAGVLLAWRARRSGDGAEGDLEPAAVPVEVRDLAEREEVLLAQLEELDDLEGKYQPAERTRERDSLEIEAATTLAALETGLREVRERRDPGRAAGARSLQSAPAAALRGFLWGAGSVAAIALLVLFVSRSTSPRRSAGVITGGEPQSAATAAAEGAPEDALAARIRSHPQDVEARLELARLDVTRGDWQGVAEQTARVLELAPNNAEALSFQGLTRFAAGDSETAISLLQRAQKADPEAIDSYAILSLVYAKTGRMDLAEATMNRAAEHFPDRRPMLTQMLDQLRAQARGEGGAAPVATTANDSAGVGGVVELPPQLQGRAPAGAVLFLIARPAGSTSGPPTAVERLTPKGFPLSFVLDDSSSMLGQPLPPKLYLEARLDSDGDPLTRSPADLHVELDGVAIGSDHLHLVLHL